MHFRDYYREVFRTDIEQVVSALPSEHDHGSTDADTTIQPRTLSRANRRIRTMEEQRLRLFAIALFFSVLVDQVMYSHFHADYSPFRALTRYPKFRGDCPGGCSNMLHPSVILETAGLRPGSLQRVGIDSYRQSLVEALPTFEQEIVSFFAEHAPQVDGGAVWRTCAKQWPLGAFIQGNE